MIEWSAKIWWARAAAIFQERVSFQYLTSSLEEDNDGRGSGSHKAALSAHRGRCGDVVTGKAGCVSKQELPALRIAALAPRRYYSHPHLTSPLTCLSPLSPPLFPRLLFISLTQTAVFLFPCESTAQQNSLLNFNLSYKVILSVRVCFVIWFELARFQGNTRHLICVVIV